MFITIDIVIVQVQNYPGVSPTNFMRLHLKIIVWLAKLFGLKLNIYFEYYNSQEPLYTPLVYIS